MKFYYVFYWIIIAAAFASCNSSVAEKEDNKPNILFIAVDDLRPELNCYGQTKMISPNIDRLAESGLMLTRAYCNVPVCGASRASLLTGTRPTRNNFLGYDTWADKDLPGNITLPEYFRQNGYYTASNGKIFHHLNDGEGSWNEPAWHPSQGDSLRNWRDYRTTVNIQISLTSGNGRGPAWEKSDVPDSAYFDGKTALKTIRDLAKLGKGEQPFFIAAGFLKPHLPFNAPAKYWDMYDPQTIGLTNNPDRAKNSPEAAYHNFGELRNYDGIPAFGPLPDSLALKLRHGYYAATSYTDAQIGLLLDALDSLGLAENTIVILWGDHGWNLGEHGLWCKHCNFNTSLQTPLIIRAPGKPSGVKSAALTEYVDIYPTLCELAGLPLPEHLDGSSFASLFEQPEQPVKEQIVSKYFDGVSLRTNRYLYTEWLNKEGETYARMLYDHQNDPDEKVNIAEEHENKALVEELAAKLRQNWGKNFQDQPDPVGI
jgi:arylsulfatase A-like enzyme